MGKHIVSKLLLGSVMEWKVRGHHVIKLRLGLPEFMTIYPDTVHTIKRETGQVGNSPQDR